MIYFTSVVTVGSLYSHFQWFGYRNSPVYGPRDYRPRASGLWEASWYLVPGVHYHRNGNWQTTVSWAGKSSGSHVQGRRGLLHLMYFDGVFIKCQLYIYIEQIFVANKVLCYVMLEIFMDSVKFGDATTISLLKYTIAKKSVSDCKQCNVSSNVVIDRLTTLSRWACLRSIPRFRSACRTRQRALSWTVSCRTLTTEPLLQSCWWAPSSGRPPRRSPSLTRKHNLKTSSLLVRLVLLWSFIVDFNLYYHHLYYHLISLLSFLFFFIPPSTVRFLFCKCCYELC